MTAAEQEKSAFPISSPRLFTHPFGPCSPALLLGSSRVSVAGPCSSAKWSPRLPAGRPRTREGGGGDGRGPAAFPSRQLPASRGDRPGSGRRGRAGLRGLLPGLGRGASPPSVAGLPRGAAGDPRPRAGTSLPAAPRARPVLAGGLGEWLLCFRGLFSFVWILFSPVSLPRGLRGAPFPSRPESGSWGGGGGLQDAKMALGLAWGQGWWRSCSAAAIFPRGGRRPVCREPGPTGAARPRAPEPPRPPAQEAGSPGWAHGGGRRSSSIVRLRPKIVGCGRVPRLLGSPWRPGLWPRPGRLGF